jgi:large subunit ribosomal protein L6
MKTKFEEKLVIPEGVSCTFENNLFKCKKGSLELSKEIHTPLIALTIKGNEIILSCKKANKIQKKIITSYIAHLKNLFLGLDEKFVYKLQAVNVHFPMTLKLEKNKLLINNFLGEKNPRVANILSGVDVDIKGQNITISSHDKTSAGQTAANIEKATKIRLRDRRIFQDGIYLIERAGRVI